MKLQYGDFSESVFNTTLFVKNSSYVVSNCTVTLHDFFSYAMLQKSQHNTTTSFLLSLLQNILGNALEINNISKLMKMYPSESLEYQFYFGLLLRKVLIVPPQEYNTDLDGPTLLMQNHSKFVLAQIAENCTTNCTTTDNSTEVAAPSKPAASLLLRPANMFQFMTGAVLGTGLINQTDPSLKLCNSTINYNIIGSGETWWS